MVSRPLSSKIAKRIGRPLAHDGVSGGGIPASLTQLLFPGDQSPYYTEEEWPGYSYRLKDFSAGVGSLRDKRGARCYLFDGVNDYLAIASLSGSETVVSSGGTAVPTISAGRIDFTAGTCWNLQISNGSIYPCQEESGTVAYDIGSNALHGTITNATLGTFHSINSAVDISYPDTYGYRLSSGVYIPKRSSSDLAADGNALTVTGRCPNYGLVKDYAWQGNGSATYVDLGSAALPSTADWEVELYYYHAAVDATIKAILSQRNTGQPGRMSIYANQASTGFAAQGRIHFFIEKTPASVGVQVIDVLLAIGWYKIVMSRVGDLFTLSATNPNGITTTASQTVASVSIYQGRNSWLLAGDSASYSYNNGRIAPMRLVTGGVTTEFAPIPGTRDIAKIVDGVGIVVPSGVVGGTLGSLYAEGPGTWQSPAVIYGANWDGTGLYPGITPLNVSANKAPITLAVDRTGGTVAPDDYATNRDGYTTEEFDDVPSDNTVNKRLEETYASDRYGSSLTDISSATYFEES